MKLKLITPEKLVLDEEVDSVTLPGLMGQMTILPGHAMLVAKLGSGKMYYKKRNLGNEENAFQISSGLVEVQKNNVIVLTPACSSIN